MARTLVRMVRDTRLGSPGPGGRAIRRWDPAVDHDRIPVVYGAAFGHEPWPADWDRFDEFDADGVFVAVAPGEGGEGGELVGISICFLRGGEGYLSVVAVLPAHRRRGIASALVRRAVDHLQERGAAVVRIDAYQDAPAAVATYRSLGFEVYDTIEDADADPRGTAEE